MKRIRVLFLSIMFTGLTTASFAEGRYEVVKKVKIGGEGGWDCLTVDPVARRLYIAHGTKVDIIDIDTDKVFGEISDTPGVHAVAIAAAFNRGFISQGKTDSVVVFDLDTLKKTGEIKTEKNPDIIIFDPAMSRVWAFNGRSQSATVIDAKTMKAVGTVPLGGKPEFAVADGSGHVYVNLEDKNSLVKINSKSRKIEATWPLSGCEEPSGLAIDAVHHRAFAACGNKTMAVIDSETGKMVTTLPIGDRVDGAVYDSEKSRVFSSNGDGTLTVIQEDGPDKFIVIETVSTQVGARTIALDPKTHQLFLVTADFGPAPAPSAEHPHPRPSVIADTFTLLVVAEKEPR